MKFAPTARWLGEPCINFAAFVLFSAILIGAFIYSPPAFSKPRDWLVIAVALFFVIMTVISFRLCASFGRQNEKASGGPANPGT
jgi:phosphotransferase system  glucose/maltose/N-acetylglucosamine-specific IIC component